MKLKVAFVMLALFLASAAHAQARRKVIIDQDTAGPGGSNMLAILLALQSQYVQVLGITVESGDAWQDEEVAHLLRMLELIGRTDVPVYRGSTYPLVNSMEATKRWEQTYGAIAYKGAWMEEWPSYNTVNRPQYHPPNIIPPMREGAPHTHPAEGTAAEFLIREVHKFPGEVTILGLGPLTNVALAARLDDSFAATAKELIDMGGRVLAAVHVRAARGIQLAVGSGSREDRAACRVEAHRDGPDRRNRGHRVYPGDARLNRIEQLSGG